MRKYDFNKKEDVEKISKRIRASFKKISKRTNGADDCAQEILLRMHEGKHQHSTIDQAVIDYLRANYGDSRLSSHSERQKLEYAHSPEPRHLERVLELADGGKSPHRLDSDECSGWVGNQIDRAALGLFYRWGLSEAEIGHLFGFSESRVCQRLQRVQKCISARVKAKESGASSSKVAIVLREETERQLWGVGEITFERMETGESFGVASFNEKSF